MGRLLKVLGFCFLTLGPLCAVQGQDALFVLTPSDVEEDGYLRVENTTEWEFKKGHDPSWKNASLDDKSWTKLDSVEIANLEFDEGGKFEGWFRFRFKMEGDFKALPLFLLSSNSAAQDIYLDGQLMGSFGNIGQNAVDFRLNSRYESVFLPLSVGETHQIAIHFVQRESFSALNSVETPIIKTKGFLYFMDYESAQTHELNYERNKLTVLVPFTLITLVLLVALLVAFLNRSEKHIRYIAYSMMFIWCYVLSIFVNFNFMSPHARPIAVRLAEFSLLGLFVILPILSSQIFYGRIPKWIRIISTITILIFIASKYIDDISILTPLVSVVSCIYIIFKSRKTISIPKWAIVVGIIGTPLCLVITFLVATFNLVDYNNIGYFYATSMSVFPVSLLVFIVLWLRDSIGNEKEKTAQVIALTEEKQTFLEDQNIKLEQKVSKRTQELNDSLENLKSTQSQLIQAEKMASLGELTAGIAHEIQNPLNFVNNFSEVSTELLDEATEELAKVVQTQHAASPEQSASPKQREAISEALTILDDIKQNLEKITHHGKRADSIVKGMLAHSRAGKGEKAPTDLNALAEEYLKLSYHGLRAKDKSFNADFKTDFDSNLPKVNVVPQDIGRVLLNLINNAFQAVGTKNASSLQPTVTVSTKTLGDKIEISVVDNGPGIPDDIKDKIFQPFFTTKPTGEGTGLGLSLSYDIVKAHGGEITVESTEGVGTKFSISLPQLT